MSVLSTIPNGASNKDIRDTWNSMLTRLASIEGAIATPTPTPTPTSSGTLSALTLAASTIAENSAAGTVIGGILNRTSGSALALASDAGGRFAISGANLVAGVTGTDFETATSHNVTVRETLAGATNSPRDTILTVLVTNVLEQPNLLALGLSTTSFVIGAAANGAITGATTGSTITATGLPTGLTINGAARTWVYDGTGTAGSATFTLNETLADSANSPRASTVAIAFAAASTAPVFLAIMAGQSNAEGRVGREAQDIDVEHVVQWVGQASAPNYRTLSADITPLVSPNAFSDIGGYGTDRLGPGEYVARQLLTDNPGCDVVVVPTAQGSTAMATSADPWYPSMTNGGRLFESMLTEANLAYSATQAAFPGRQIIVRVFFIQGEQDANNGITRAAYLASLSNWVSFARARLTGGSGAIVVVGSMVPEKWMLTDTNLQASFAIINQAQVDASLQVSGVRYAVGPVYSTGSRDYLHYQPAQRCRDQGRRLAAALSDTVGPTVTAASTYSSTAGSVLVIALTGNDQHQTFHINGGANAGQFEISDPYLNPTLRWTGNGSGPAVGAYVVGVRARDGAGNYGATLTVTVTVAATGNVSPASFFGSGERGMVWDLLDTATLFQDVAGTTPVTAAGHPVGRVLDKSPNANHWTAAANDTTRPTYQVDADGKPYLQFDGSNDVLLAATPFVNGATGGSIAFTSAIGIYAAAQSATKTLLSTGSTTAATPFVVPFQADGTTASVVLAVRNDAGSAFAKTSLAAVLDSTKRVMTSKNAGPNGVSALRNAGSRPVGGGSGAYTSIAQGSVGALPVSLTRAGLGANCAAAPANFYAGRIYSGYVIGRVLTDSEITNAEDWVASRTLTAALP